eukprot:TRINITY_DN4808_c0_g1_i1.p1 TRINITY_DN4808_c0_g1~~TRINITY_DN4808_c0_g1_i1.p1  ORF type:complete len:359 (+),score=117.60 TRINITY_DN4808_c0_g1_i1:51-1127(+)
MMRSMLLRTARAQAQTRFNTVAAAPESQAADRLNSFDSSKRASENQESANKQQSVVPLLGVVGAVALGYTFFQLSRLKDGELALRKAASERVASGYKPTDPMALRQTLANHVRCIQPEDASQLTSYGTQVAMHGLTDELRNSAHFAILESLKSDHDAMSWADLGAYIAFHSLREMGGPVVGMEPKFGRSEAETLRRREKGWGTFPGADATFEEFKAFGDQYGLTEVELVAILGGHSSGSVLFNPSKASLLDVQLYKRFVKAKASGASTADIPFAQVLGHDDFSQQCTDVFARDNLHWNLYFARGFEKILTGGWTGLRALPDRFEKSHNDASWVARQKDIYGVETAYQGAQYRRKETTA